MDMHFADLGIVLILLLFLIRGYVSGFVLSVIAIIVLIISLFLATLYSSELSIFLKDWLFFLDGPMLQIVSFLIVFLLVFTLLNWLSKITKILNKIPLIGNLNQSLGALLGLMKGFIVVSLLLFMITFHSDGKKMQEYMEEGVLYSYFDSIAPAVFNGISALVPFGTDFYNEFNETVKNEVDKQIETLKEN